MENQMSVGEQNTQQIGQNSVGQPMSTTEKPKVNYWMITTFVLLVILVAGGMYTFNLATKLSNNQNANQIPITTSPSPVTSTEPTPTTAVITSPTNNVVWKTQIIQIQHESAFLGSKTVNLEIKIPESWTLQTYPRKADPNDLIKNCSDYVITTPIVGLSMTLSPICSGWAAKYSSWPADAVIALQQKRSGNDGPHNYYRVRYATSSNNYNYVDSMTDPNRSLDKSKDQIMDAILIGYAPPNESTNDFFFIAARLTVIYHPAAGEEEKFLSIADQIASLLKLR